MHLGVFLPVWMRILTWWSRKRLFSLIHFYIRAPFLIFRRKLSALWRIWWGFCLFSQCFFRLCSPPTHLINKHISQFEYKFVNFVLTLPSTQATCIATLVFRSFFSLRGRNFLNRFKFILVRFIRSWFLLRFLRKNLKILGFDLSVRSVLMGILLNKRRLIVLIYDTPFGMMLGMLFGEIILHFISSRIDSLLIEA